MKLTILLMSALLPAALAKRVATCTNSGTPLVHSPHQERSSRFSHREVAHSLSKRATKPKGYTAVVVFGASYCDNAHPRDPAYNGSLRPPPYYQGRYSNGPIFIEQLANGSLGYKANLLDYAFGGAQANNALTSGTVPDTRNQSRQYISDVTTGKAARGKGRVLHVWWIGINPITQIWTDAIKANATTGNTTAASRAQSRVQKQIDEVLSQVKAVKANTKVQALESNYLLMPIPPLEIVPNLYFQAQTLANNNATLASEYLAYVGKLTTQYNTGLTNGLASLGPTAGTKGWVRTYNIPAFWRDMNANPAKFNLTNVTDSCLNPSTNVPCSTPNAYLYWDTLHPTTQIHKFIATKLASVAITTKVQS